MKPKGRVTDVKRVLVRISKVIFFFVISKKYFFLSLLPPATLSYLLFSGILTLDFKVVGDLLGWLIGLLVAILAIIVSSTLWVAAQVALRYNIRMFWRVFRHSTFAYIILCIACILLPLVILASNDRLPQFIHHFLVNFSLILTFACLSFLPLYLLYITNWLEPETFLAELTGEAKKKLRRTKGKQLPKEVNTLRDLVIGSSPTEHYTMFIGGIRALRDIAIFSISMLPKKGKKNVNIEEVENSDVSEVIMYILRDIERSLMTDSTAPIAVVNEIPYALGGIGGELVETNRTSAKKALELLVEIGSRARPPALSEKEWVKVSLQVVNALNYVGIKAMNSDLPSLRKEVITYLRFAFSVNATVMPNVARTAIYHLVGLGKKALDKKFDNELRYIFSALGMVALKSVELNWERAIPRAISSLRVFGISAAFSGLQNSTKAAIRSLSRVASKVVELDNKDWVVQTIVSLENVISKAADQSALLDVTIEGVKSLGKIAQACEPDHPNVTFVTQQLWIIGAKSPSEEITSHILSELEDLARNKGKEIVDKGFKKAWWWARTKSPNLKKALNKVCDRYRMRSRASEILEDWDEFDFFRDEY